MKKKSGATGVDNSPQGKFGELADDVSRIETESVQDKISPDVAAWSVPLKEIYHNDGLRLDAVHYDRNTAEALKELQRSKYPLKRLSKIATLTLPSMFARIWAKSSKYGVPYLNATDLMSLEALGTLGEKLRYLSFETDVDINELIIHEGWLVLTCSGTIGRVFYIPERLDGWAATHDLIRISPHKDVPVGFLHSYLSSPLAQAQILGHTHGGQIDHVTDEQVGNILVPIFPPALVEDIHNNTMHALQSREKAMQAVVDASLGLHSLLTK